MGRLLIINPNSNKSVTQGIRDALDLADHAKDLEITCVELAEGPFGIESDEDIRAVVPLLVDEVVSCQDSYDAFVVACYSDPGLAECRTITDKPVLGIHESAARLAAASGRKFGVLALGQESIRRHTEYIDQLGLKDSHGGERPLHITVDEAANSPDTLNKIIENGRALIDKNGVQSIVLGCAGMARHRQAAEEALRVPVIDPVQAAAKLADHTLHGTRFEELNGVRVHFQ